MKRSLKFYIKLFIYSFNLSAFTFGGGYVIVPLMKNQFVDKLGWINEREMVDFIAIAQSAPGPIAVNASLLVGYNLAGMRGAFIAMTATILPPFIFITVISFFYNVFIENRIVQGILYGMQAGVCAVIIDVVIDMSRSIIKLKKFMPVAIMVFAFIGVFIFNINVIYIILASGMAGVFIFCKKKNYKG